MAQYKVPQDVEADDKLVFGLSFRQFVYLFIAIACIGATVGFFQIPNFGPMLAVLPIPIAIFFAALGLPIKRDQPMETYLAAILSFYFKPRKHYWNPGQRDSTVEIMAPKIVEAPRTRNISGEEASHRLSFLANVVDTEGRSINSFNNTSMQEDFVAEAQNISDIYETRDSVRIEAAINAQTAEARGRVVNQMRQAIEADKRGEVPYMNQRNWNNNYIPNESQEYGHYSSNGGNQANY